MSQESPKMCLCHLDMFSYQAIEECHHWGRQPDPEMKASLLRCPQTSFLGRGRGKGGQQKQLNSNHVLSGRWCRLNTKAQTHPSIIFHHHSSWAHTGDPFIQTWWWHTEQFDNRNKPPDSYKGAEIKATFFLRKAERLNSDKNNCVTKNNPESKCF